MQLKLGYSLSFFVSRFKGRFYLPLPGAKAQAYHKRRQSKRLKRMNLPSP
jgi:hypothetical protein